MSFANGHLTTPSHELPALAGRSHPLRLSLSEEMHARRFPPFGAPALIVQFVVLIAEEDMVAAREHAEALCRHFGVPVPPSGRHLRVQLRPCAFAWEQHSEFATYSFIRTGAFTSLFGEELFTDALPADWLSAMPGQVIRGSRIALIDRDSPNPSPEQLARYFDPEDLVCCDVLGGKARIWSDFRLHADGFGRLLIQDRGLADGEASRLTQHLQELGNYRKMALLGLAVARERTPMINALERRLADLSHAITRSDEGGDDLLLEGLSQLSAELARHAAETSYRMSATQAYAEIVNDRLRSLQSVAVPGYPTLIEFTERRLVPAVRTCSSFSRRLEDLAQRAAWASALMRTRIDTVIERQSRDLLASMDRRTNLQLRLQQTVEGLSVAAISYYVVGLVGYLLKSLQAILPGFDPATTTGLVVPLVVLAVWFSLHRLKRALRDD